MRKTGPEEDFDQLTLIASQICGMPIALITFLDETRQWFKSSKGLDVSETARELAFCAHAINTPDALLQVEDARKDDRFHDNPFVVGEPHVIFYAGVPLVTEEGLPLGTLCVIDNKPNKLTPQQAEALSALSKQVMKLLELRKKKQQLEAAFDRLSKKNIALERFASTAAHDINSPLIHLSSISALLSKQYAGQLDAQAIKLLSGMELSATRLRTLVDGLLAYSRIDSLLQEKKEHIATEVFFKGIKAHFTQAEPHEIKVTTELDQLYVHAVAFEQILINLIGNAIKYSDKPTATVEVGVELNGATYVVSVKDDGPGIALTEQEYIFEAFEVGGSEDRYGRSGSGLGLAIVKDLVERLGGSIHVESASGQGATFIFSIAKN